MWALEGCPRGTGRSPSKKTWGFQSIPFPLMRISVSPTSQVLIICWHLQRPKVMEPLYFVLKPPEPWTNIGPFSMHANYSGYFVMVTKSWPVQAVRTTFFCKNQRMRFSGTYNWKMLNRFLLFYIYILNIYILMNPLTKNITNLFLVIGFSFYSTQWKFFVTIAIHFLNSKHNFI